MLCVLPFVIGGCKGCARNYFSGLLVVWENVRIGFHCFGEVVRDGCTVVVLRKGWLDGSWLITYLGKVDELNARNRGSALCQ